MSSGPRTSHGARATPAQRLDQRKLLDAACAALGVDDEALGKRLGIKESTIRHWRYKRLMPEHRRAAVSAMAATTKPE